MRDSHHPIPKILNGIINFTRWSINNPMNGMDYLEIAFSDAIFISDFGPWKKGYKPYLLTFDPFNCSLTEGNNWGELVKYCEVSLIEKPKEVYTLYDDESTHKKLTVMSKWDAMMDDERNPTISEPELEVGKSYKISVVVEEVK